MRWIKPFHIQLETVGLYKYHSLDDIVDICLAVVDTSVVLFTRCRIDAHVVHFNVVLFGV